MNHLTETIGEGQKGFEDRPNKRRNLNGRLVAPYFGKHRADRISSFLMQHYVQNWLDKDAKTATVNRELATLSRFVRRMAQWGWIPDEDRPEITREDQPRNYRHPEPEEH